MATRTASTSRVSTTSLVLKSVSSTFTGSTPGMPVAPHHIDHFGIILYLLSPIESAVRKLSCIQWSEHSVQSLNQVPLLRVVG